MLSKGSDYGNYTLEVGGRLGPGTTPYNVNYVHRVSEGNFSCCAITPGPLSYGGWNHVAVTFSSGTARIYVNGAFITGTSGASDPLQNTAALTLGRVVFQSAPTRYMRGLIDELRIWNVARTATEIAQSYNKAISPGTAGLVAYYKFDEGEGQTVVDSTQFVNHGTLGADGTTAPDDPARVISTAPLVP